MQEIRPDISEEKSEKQNDYPAGDNSEAGAVKPVSESDKINSIRDALNKIAQKEEEEEILDRITENVKYVKDRKDNREKYAEQIKRLQELVSKVTEQGVTIQAQEARNKQLIERYFAKQRTGIKTSRVASKAAYDYYKNMSNAGHVPPQFMDSKK